MYDGPEVAIYEVDGIKYVRVQKATTCSLPCRCPRYVWLQEDDVKALAQE